MNSQKPDWYDRLNQNERRIIDVFIEDGCRFFIARPVLEKQLCKTKLMDSRTLTTRLDYLIEKGHIGKVRGKKGAVFYAPGFLVDLVLRNPRAKSIVDDLIDNTSPKDCCFVPMPVNVMCRHISDEETCELLIRAAETWERIGVGSERSKSKVYRELLRLRKDLRRKAEMEREPE